MQDDKRSNAKPRETYQEITFKVYQEKVTIITKKDKKFPTCVTRNCVTRARTSAQGYDYWSQHIPCVSWVVDH